MYYNNVDSPERRHSALCCPAGFLEGGAGALWGALPRLGEGSVEGSSLALGGRGELILCNAALGGGFALALRAFGCLIVGY